MTGADYHLAAGETPRQAASRSWTYLQGVYRSYRDELAKLPAGQTGTALTREKWLQILLRELDYGRVPTTPAGTWRSGTRSTRSRTCGPTCPMHLLGWGIDLDSRTEKAAGAARAPQSMVQEFLNRSDDHLWAVLSNGRQLRLLRDNTALVGQAYVEFDLEAIFDGGVVHRLRPHVAGLPAIPPGTPTRPSRRDRGADRGGDHRPLAGTLAHPRHRDRHPRPGRASRPGDEGDRGPRHRVPAPPRQRPPARPARRRADHQRGPATRPCCASSTGCCSGSSPRTATPCSTRPLTTPPAPATPTTSPPPGCAGSPTAASAPGTPTCGRPHGSSSTASAGRTAAPSSASPGSAGCSSPARWTSPTPPTCPTTPTADRRSGSLSTTREKGGARLRAVDYRNLGAEELGSIYEALLELHPRIDPVERTFTLATPLATSARPPAPTTPPAP